MKCRVCKINISNEDIREEKAVKFTHNGVNHYICCEHASDYIKELKKSEKWYKDRDEIDKFVKENILFYREGQQLPKLFFDRLSDLGNGTERGKGGKVVNNNGLKSGYPLEVILQTFKSQRERILYAFRTISFKNESQKLNYMWRIIEGNLNDEYDRWDRQQKINKSSTSVINEDVADEQIDKIFNEDNVIKPKAEERTDLSWILKEYD